MSMISSENIYLFFLGLALLLSIFNWIIMIPSKKRRLSKAGMILNSINTGWILGYGSSILLDQYPTAVKSLVLVSESIAVIIPIAFLHFAILFANQKIEWKKIYWLWPILLLLISFLPSLWGSSIFSYDLAYNADFGYRAMARHSLITKTLYAINLSISGFAMVIILNSLFKVNPHFQKTAMVLVALMISPILATVMRTFMPTDSFNKFNFTPIFLSFNIFSLSIFIKSSNIKNLTILARDKFFNEFQNGAVIIDDEGTIFDINQNAVQILGEKNQKDILNKKLKDYFPLDSLHQGIRPLDESEPDILWFSPGEKEYEIYNHPMVDMYGELFGRMITFVDVTELNQLLRQTHELSIRDTLTRAFNRRHFEAMTAKTFANAVRYGNPISIMLIDIDNFKKINDAYGHLSGDKVLIKAADNFYQEMRDADTIARYGGDEFVILMPNTPLEGAIQAAQRIVRRCQITKFNFVDEDNLLSVSIGLSSWFSKPGENAPSNHEALLNQADQALYYAKNSPTIQMAYYQNGTFRIIPALKLDKPHPQ